MNSELQEKISEVIGLDLSDFHTYTYDGDSYWLGCEITQWLGLSNTTQAIKAKIKFPSFRMEYIPHVNENRRVHLLNLNGIIQVIKKNRNTRTRILQHKLDAAGF
ncbi:hypothetical protein [Trichlorobacter lovleyi]|uniref:hypothetical protein n=1 Tax=Trichlorobacter lovleyi TaxID=313985 RepID=UPI003D09C795